MRSGLLVEAQRVERAIGRIRWGAALLEFVLGPRFPTISLLGVYVLGVFIVAYNLVTLRASSGAGSMRVHRRVAALAFAGDLAALSAAMLLFSPDPLWSTYFIGVLVIMAGAFRFGTVGTLSATAVVSLAYLAVAIYRQAAFGFPVVFERSAFDLSVFALTGLLLDRALRDARQLRDEREGLITRLERRVAEDEAIEQVMRIVAGIPSADAVVPAVLRASRDVLRFERATVFIAEEEAEEYRAIYRLGGDRVAAPRFKIGEGLVGAAMREGTLLVPNVLADPRYTPRPDERARSVILVPLRVGGRAIALFSLSRLLPEVFGPDDLRLAETVAGLVAQVLENDRLFAAASQAEALRAADRLKDAFLATVSHELRTPLTVIAGSLELLGRAGEADRAKLIAQARRHVERLDRQVQDLLDVARMEHARVELEREYIPCRALLDEAAAAHAVIAAQRDQSIDVICDEPARRAYVDRRRMQQLLGNLVANAVRYAPAGSRITLSAAARDGHLRFAVRDEGEVIPAAERERIFEKFYRRPQHRDEAGGTGLGLAIVRMIAELHGGTVVLEDGGSAGNAFVVELPA